ncbi:hypothetical protein A5660_20825 [Mycobacterium alsense]|nr:hypothetical protein [Mycobacterium alsense]OBJ03026.1 hypothetical protein A5660_20825 [Mycobacterium alsense]
MLLSLRPGDLVHGPPDAAPRALDAVSRAVVDLPYATVRRHAYDDPMPDWLEADVATAAPALLQGPLKGLRERA